MLSQLSVITYQTEKRAYHFLCDPQSPTSEIKEAMCYFIKYVSQIEDQAKSAAEAAAKEKEEKQEHDDVGPSV